mmetsp:Transcript_14639/g.42856  ORF Transcript_14639/g.42856 Transcript_14639/m.42856 type:complete len:530 (-) Transcript_14639:468-2057(-)
MPLHPGAKAPLRPALSPSPPPQVQSQTRQVHRWEAMTQPAAPLPSWAQAAEAAPALGASAWTPQVRHLLLHAAAATAEAAEPAAAAEPASAAQPAAAAEPAVAAEPTAAAKPATASKPAAAAQPVAAAEPADGKHAVAAEPTAAAKPAAAGDDSPLLAGIQFINPAFEGVDSEAKFIGLLEKMGASGKCPEKLLPLWKDFFNNYKGAIIGSNQKGANERLVAQVQASIADVVLNQFKDSYTFPAFHKRILEPYNYYAFGQRYVGSLTDFDNSVLGQPERWDQIDKWLQEGENVILLANHQTEADPGVFAYMLEASHPTMATDVVYVAGDRVVTDALCKPFSMGRNLFCVHSKKHLDDIPELKAYKMETNRKTLVAMSRRLNEGGALLWIAPSGGRDRPKENGKWSPDMFDAPAVELMRNIGNRAKKPTHLVPMAMFSYPMMPPPPKAEKDVGERRLTAFTPVGISACEELNVKAIVGGITDKDEAQVKLAKAAWTAVTEEYAKLEEAILDPSKRGTTYVQPWKKAPSTA